MIVPPFIEDALWTAARKRLPPEVCGGPALTAAVIDRSRRYTSERERLVAPSTGRAAAADLAARALFFTIADVAKPWLPLAELADGLLPAPAGFLAGDALRVLDVGAGCGAMTIGLLAFLARRPHRPALRLILVDRDAGALEIAADAIAIVARTLELDVTVTVRCSDVDAIAQVTPRSFDLVLAGTVLNELDGDGPRMLTAAMLAAAKPLGVVLIIEPALRQTTRALHHLRDELIADRRATVLAPCSRRGAPCPALLDERDWCHDHRPVSLPPRTNQLAQVTGLRDGAIKLSYLALTPSFDVPVSPAVRAVSDPRAEKGKHALMTCGRSGWVPMRLLRRHRGESNRGFERARRGDLLLINADRGHADASGDQPAVSPDLSGPAFAPAPLEVPRQQHSPLITDGTAPTLVELSETDHVELLVVDRGDG